MRLSIEWIRLRFSLLGVLEKKETPGLIWFRSKALMKSSCFFGQNCCTLALHQNNEIYQIILQLSIYLSIYLSVYISIYLSIYSIYLSIYISSRRTPKEYTRASTGRQPSKTPWTWSLSFLLLLLLSTITFTGEGDCVRNFKWSSIKKMAMPYLKRFLETFIRSIM